MPLLFEFRGEGRRSGVTERRVQPLGVVGLDPVRNDVAGLAKREEQSLVEQLVAQTPPPEQAPARQRASCPADGGPSVPSRGRAAGSSCG